MHNENTCSRNKIKRFIGKSLFYVIVYRNKFLYGVKTIAANRKLYRLMNDSAVIYQDND